MINIIKFTITTVAPVGESSINEENIPIMNAITETIAEVITTAPKLLHTRRAERAGKIIRLDISIAPIIRIPITLVTAVKTAIRELKRVVFVPVAFANESSKVIAKILL